MRATPAPVSRAASRAAALTLSAAMTAILLLAMLSLGIERRTARRGAAMTVELLPLPPTAPPPSMAPKRRQPDTPTRSHAESGRARAGGEGGARPDRDRHCGTSPADHRAAPGDGADQGRGVGGDRDRPGDR